MGLPRLADVLDEFRQQGLRGAHRLDEHTHGWLSILAGAAGEILKPDAATMAAAIAYFALFSLFPLTLLSISFASYSLGSKMDQQLIIGKLEFVAPALGRLLGANIDEIIQARGPITGVALIGLVWTASAIFHSLNQILNKIWSSKRRRPFWKHRGVSILFVLTFVGPALILVSFAGSLIANLRAHLPAQVIPIGDGLDILVTILLDIALFMLLYSLLPHGAATWREIWPGVLAAGLLWELAKKGFLSFVATYMSVSNLVYGSVTAILAFLIWAYLSSLIFLFGAFLSVQYYHSRHQPAAAD